MCGRKGLIVLSKILFCPHCSSNTAPRITIIEGKDGFRNRYAVLCDYENGGCGAEGGYRHSEEEAIAVWNERSPIPVPTNIARKVKTVTITYDIEVYEDDTEEDIRDDVYCTLQTLEYQKIPHTLHIDVKDKRCDNG